MFKRNIRLFDFPNGLKFSNGPAHWQTCCKVPCAKTGYYIYRESNMQTRGECPKDACYETRARGSTNLACTFPADRTARFPLRTKLRSTTYDLLNPPRIHI
jgi:hypothetical protein